MKKIIKIIFFLVVFLPTKIYAQIPLNVNYPTFGGVTPGPGMEFSDLVTWLYYAIVTIATAAAFGMIIWGGFEYMTSVGDSSRMTSAREKIKDAVIGLLIILISYLALQTINPQFIQMPSLNL